jgi:hypothetical protein
LEGSGHALTSYYLGNFVEGLREITETLMTVGGQDEIQTQHFPKAR